MLIFAVGSVKKSLTCSLAPFFVALTGLVLRLYSFCGGSLTVKRPSTLPKNFEQVQRTFWSCATAFRTLPLNAFPPSLVADPLVEVDEMYQNAGEKGIPHLDPHDPPRRRANKVRGHGNFHNDRVPILGVFGRASGVAALDVIERADDEYCVSFIREKTRSDAEVHSDEWTAYYHLEKYRRHKTVNHGKTGNREWARDEDGDGYHEVHCNTAEGFWVGLRNFLRMFRGVSKYFLSGYVAFYEALHNYREDGWALMGLILSRQR